MRFQPNLLLLVLISFSLNTSAQQTPQQIKEKKERLQNQYKQLQKEIAQMEGIIKNTSAKKEQNLQQVQALKDKITSREKLIGNINNQIGELNDNIEETADNIQQKSTQVEDMKARYADMLRKTYRNKSLQNQLTFIVSANTFDEAVKRYSYLKKVGEYERSQAKLIHRSITDLEEQKTELVSDKQEKESLRKQEAAQKERLEAEKKNKDEMLSKLTEQEKRLKTEIVRKNKAAQALNNKINVVIQEEIRAARKKAEQEAREAAAREARAKNKTTTTVTIKTKPKAEDAPMLTAKDEALSKDFANNRGRLPWPVAKGAIVSGFGRQQHPLLKEVIIENNGVDIKTAGSEARSIFGGTVVSVFYLPTTQYCIIIKHGEYFTVYSNIANAKVKSGETVSTKQAIGSLYTDKDDNLTKVHLEIWRGKDKMNPQDWLAN